MTRPVLRWVCLVLAITGLAALGSIAPQASTETPADDAYRSVERITETLHLIQQRHIDRVPMSLLLDRVLTGVVAALDPYSRYLPPSDPAPQDTPDTATFGIGIEVEDASEGPVIRSITAGGPADMVGLRVGDVVVDIDDTPVSVAHQVRDQILGQRGSETALTVRRDGSTQTLRPVRDFVAERSVSYTSLTDGIILLSVSRFTASTAHDARRAILDAQTNHVVSGIILDLRGNSGGLLEEGFSLLDIFTSSGLLFELRGRDAETAAAYYATAAPDDIAVPLMVLVDHNTASTAEIVAGALQDRGRATIVGTQTTGKGSVQRVYPLRGGGELHLTVARYNFQSGRTISDGEGLVPDVPVGTRLSSVQQSSHQLREELEQLALPEATRLSLLRLLAEVAPQDAVLAPQPLSPAEQDSALTAALRHLKSL